MRYGEIDQEIGLNLVHIVRPAARYDRGGKPDSGTPGLLLLHGRGADEADLMGIEQALDPRLTIVSARAPFRMGPGYAWYDITRLGEPEEESLHESMGKLVDFIDGMIKTYQIDPTRLYAMGFSQGAIISAGLALTMPERLRGVVIHSGYVPFRANLDANPGGLFDKPFFVAHGKYDDIIPVNMGREGYEYLLSVGADVTYQEYPIGHTISEESLYDLSQWLANQLDRTE